MSDSTERELSARHAAASGGARARLCLLGVVELTGSVGADSAHDRTPRKPITQAKLLAVLGYLAAASPRGFHRRDVLTALFWPELDQERSRASLRKALHHVRRQIGADVIVNRGDEEVGVDSAQLWCDVVEFDAALDKGDSERGLALYRGELMAGFYLAGESEAFEHWLDRERGRLRARASRAAWALAEQAEAERDSSAAAGWLRRAVELSPDDEGGVRRGITLLDRLGDRAGALRLFDEFARRLDREMGATPAAETAALVRTVRDRVRAHPDLLSAVEPIIDATPAAATGQPSTPPKSLGARWRARLVAALGAMLVVATVTLGLVVHRRGASAHERPSIGAADANVPAIAITDFAPAATDTSAAYLGQGLREELAVRLGRLGRFRIKSGGSVRRALSLGVADPAALGRTLGIQYLVDGTVRRAGPHVRLTVHLMRATDGVQLWADEFDVTSGSGDLLRVEGDLAQRIATAVGGQLTTVERAVLTRMTTTDSAAYDHYLRGNYYLSERTPRTIDRAVAEYRRATLLDPTFVAPLARVAYAYGLIADWGWRDSLGTPETLTRRGLALADSAVARDSNSADAWLARAYLLALSDPRAMRGAPEAFERSLALDSTNAEAYHQYGQLLMVLGRAAEAERAYRLALSFEPDRGMTLVPLAALAHRAHRDDDAMRWIDSAVTVDPRASYTYVVRGTIREELGDTAGTRVDAETALRVDSTYAVPAEAMLARALARSNPPAARAHLTAALAHMRDAARPSPTDVMFVAPAAAVLGDQALAAQLVEHARPRGAYLWWYLTEPSFDALRKDARVRRVVEDARPPSIPRSSAEVVGNTIAVLPFANMSAAGEDEYLADGMTEELTATLAQVPQLRVVSRTSAFAFKGHRTDVRWIADSLGVATVVEGSVRHAGNRLRVTAELVNARDGHELWSSTYEQELGDAVGIQEAIARALVDTLRVRLPGAPAALVQTHTRDPQAYMLYLKGRAAWNTRTAPGLRTAADDFRAAVTSDTSFAKAHAALAQVYTSLGTYGLIRGDSALDLAWREAGRALALDSALTEAYVTRGAVVALRGDYAAGEAAYRKAIELQPSNATAHHWYALLLVVVGRAREAVLEMQRAASLDPLATGVNNAYGAVLRFARDYPGAVAQLERTLRMAPESPQVLTNLGVAYIDVGRTADAVRTLRRALEKLSGDPETTANLVAAYARQGDTTAARAALGTLLRPARGAPSAFYVGLAYTVLGDRDAAFHWLDRTDWVRDALPALRADPLLDPVRGDARFGRLLHRLSLQ